MNENGECIEQRGQWWWFEHAKIVLSHIHARPLAQRRREQWEETVRNATRLICARDANKVELAKATVCNGYMERCVELLESEIEEEKCLRRQADEMQREQRSAACAFV